MRAFRVGAWPESSKASDGRLKGKLSSRLTTCIGRSRAPAGSIERGAAGGRRTNVVIPGDSDEAVEGNQDARQPQGRVRRRFAGESPLSLFRKQGGRRRPERRRGAVPLDRRRRDRARA